MSELSVHRTHNNINKNDNNINKNDNDDVGERNQASLLQESRIQELKEHSEAITLKYATTLSTFTIPYCLSFFHALHFTLTAIFLYSSY